MLPFLLLAPFFLGLALTQSVLLGNITIDDANPDIRYSSGWETIISSNPSYSNGTLHYGSEVNAQISFTGVAVYFLAPRWTFPSAVELSLDGESAERIDLRDTSVVLNRSNTLPSQPSQPVWSKNSLENTLHTLEVRSVEGQLAVFDSLIIMEADASGTPSTNGVSLDSTSPTTVSVFVTTTRGPSQGPTAPMDRRPVIIGAVVGMSIAILGIFLAFVYVRYRRGGGSRFRRNHPSQDDFEAVTPGMVNSGLSASIVSSPSAKYSPRPPEIDKPLPSEPPRSPITSPVSLLAGWTTAWNTSGNSSTPGRKGVKARSLAVTSFRNPIKKDHPLRPKSGSARSGASSFFPEPREGSNTPHPRHSEEPMSVLDYRLTPTTTNEAMPAPSMPVPVANRGLNVKRIPVPLFSPGKSKFPPQAPQVPVIIPLSPHQMAHASKPTLPLIQTASMPITRSPDPVSPVSSLPTIHNLQSSAGDRLSYISTPHSAVRRQLGAIVEGDSASDSGKSSTKSRGRVKGASRKPGPSDTVSSPTQYRRSLSARRREQVLSMIGAQKKHQSITQRSEVQPKGPRSRGSLEREAETPDAGAPPAKFPSGVSDSTGTGTGTGTGSSSFLRSELAKMFPPPPEPQDTTSPISPISAALSSGKSVSVLSPMALDSDVVPDSARILGIADVAFKNPFEGKIQATKRPLPSAPAPQTSKPTPAPPVRRKRKLPVPLVERQLSGYDESSGPALRSAPIFAVAPQHPSDVRRPLPAVQPNTQLAYVDAGPPPAYLAPSLYAANANSTQYNSATTAVDRSRVRSLPVVPKVHTQPLTLTPPMPSRPPQLVSPGISSAVEGLAIKKLKVPKSPSAESLNLKSTRSIPPMPPTPPPPTPPPQKRNGV